MNCESSKPISFDYGTSEWELSKKAKPMLYIVLTEHKKMLIFILLAGNT